MSRGARASPLHGPPLRIPSVGNDEVEKFESGEDVGLFVKAVPNIITGMRLLLLPVVIELVAARSNPWLIWLTLGVMGATDFLDGYVARRLNAVTTFGKVFDPSLDRVVIIVMALDFTVKHVMPLYVAIPLLVRELAVTLTTGILAVFYKKRTDVVWIGKAGTFALLTAIPLLVFHIGTTKFEHYLYLGGLYLAIAGTAALYLAGYDYLKLFIATVRGNGAETSGDDKLNGIGHEEEGQ